MKLNRRQLVKALGLAGVGGLGARALGDFNAIAEGASPPMRVVFFVTPHGHVPSSWKMGIPDGPTDAFAERALAPLPVSEFCPVLKPLHAFRDRLLAIEGLSRTSVLADIAKVQRTGGDGNNHQLAVSGLLTCTHALQRVGTTCSGGGRSLDQELGLRMQAPGRFNSRVYGYDYTPNSHVSPFSFVGPGQASPMVSDPAVAFSDLLGFYKPPSGDAGVLTREQRLAQLRPSVLDIAAKEYEALAPKLGSAGRERLDSHRQLIRDLEQSMQSTTSALCTPNVDMSGHAITRFMRSIRMAFACDLTRVATFVAPVPPCPEFGYPADTAVHPNYAHASVPNATSCGQDYSPVAQQAMTDLSAWYAGHLASLLRELDGVVEGSGTLLDHTVVVWVTELATPTHEHHNAFTVLAGGSNFFKTGRYVRYPQIGTEQLGGHVLRGASQSQLYVSVMRAMGQSDDSFGLAEVVTDNGSTVSLRGPLRELQRS